MVAFSVPLFVLTLFSLSFTSADQKNFTAEPGNAFILPCRSSDQKPVAAVDWTRRDLGKKYVLSFRDEKFDTRNQHPSYKDRVDLQDRQMKTGDVSLVLKNLTTNDTGTYDCVVQNEGSGERKLISTINLQVVSPGKKDGGSKDGGSKDGSSGVIVGLIVGLIVCLVAVGILLVMYQKKSACFKKKTPDPAADL